MSCRTHGTRANTHGGLPFANKTPAVQKHLGRGAKCSFRMWVSNILRFGPADKINAHVNSHSLAV